MSCPASDPGASAKAHLALVPSASADEHASEADEPDLEGELLRTIRRLSPDEWLPRP